MHHKSKLWAYVADICVSAVYAYAFISSPDQNMFIFLTAMIYVSTTRCYLGKCQHVISYSKVAYMLSRLIVMTTRGYIQEVHSRIILYINYAIILCSAVDGTSANVFVNNYIYGHTIKLIM